MDSLAQAKAGLQPADESDRCDNDDHGEEEEAKDCVDSAHRINTFFLFFVEIRRRKKVFPFKTSPTTDSVDDSATTTPAAIGNTASDDQRPGGTRWNVSGLPKDSEQPTCGCFSKLWTTTADFL